MEGFTGGSAGEKLLTSAKKAAKFFGESSLEKGGTGAVSVNEAVLLVTGTGALVGSGVYSGILNRKVVCKADGSRSKKVCTEDQGMTSRYAVTRVSGYDVTRVSGYDVTRVSGYDVTRVSGYDVTRVSGYDVTRVRRHEGIRV